VAKKTKNNDDPKHDSTYWLDNIEKSQSDLEKYNKRCDRIRKRYLYESSASTALRKYQLLWSNMELLKPATYARCPLPVVNPRWTNNDNDIDRMLCQMIEKTLTVQIDLSNFNHSMELVRDDYLLYGRGWSRLTYEATFDSVTSEYLDYEDMGDEDEQDVPQPEEKLTDERICVEFVDRKDLVYPPKSRHWCELPWLAIRAYKTKPEVEKRWGKEVADKMQFSKNPGNTSRDERKNFDSAEDQAEIWEIWNKDEKWVAWVSFGYDGFIEKGDPYLHFQDFYPGPKPCFATMSGDLIPVPDFHFYEDQANEVDILTQRIAGLSDSLKVAGWYPGGPQGEGSPEIEKVLRPGFENRLVAVSAWDVFTQGTKNSAPIVFLPITDIVNCIKECISLRQQVIEDVYSITGISDIMRGVTQAEESAAAVGLKGTWGSVRLKQKQGELARYARDLFRQMTEVIAQCFSVETLMECSMTELPTDADIQELAQKMQMQAQQAQVMAAHSIAPPGAPQAAQGQPPAGGMQPPRPMLPPQQTPVQQAPMAPKPPVPPQGVPVPPQQGMTQ
jgi:hypothetical protein